MERGFDENGEHDKFSVCPVKQGLGSSDPLKMQKMAKMVGVTRAKAWFTKSRAFCSRGQGETRRRGAKAHSKTSDFGTPVICQNCLQWGRSNLVDPAEWPKIGLLNRGSVGILAVFS